MRFYLRIVYLIAIAALTWPATALAQQADQAPADEQQKLNGAVDFLEHFAVRRIIEAVAVDATQVASFRRAPDTESETWSVTGSAEITDLTGNRARQPYSAQLEVLCDSVERRGCWDLKSLTLGQRTLSGKSATVVTMADLNQPAEPEPTAVPQSNQEAVATLGGSAGNDGSDGQDIGALRTKAEKGDPDAQYQLAEKYRVGFPVEQDIDKALELYKRSAGQGFASAEFRLGELYEEGKFVERDLAKAVNAYREAAEQGHAGAQYALAHIYHLGSGVEQDMATAMFWYRKAADQGDEWSQLALGDQYRIGLAVPRNLEQSTRWYRLAADQGNIFAQYELGNAYRYGNGVKRDTAQASKWYRLSAEAGNPSAQLALAELATGDGSGATPAATAPEIAQDGAAGLVATAPDEEPALSDADMTSVAEEKAAMELSENGSSVPDGSVAPSEDGAAGSSGERLALVATPSLSDARSVSQLLSRAQDQLANLALTTPAGANAYDTYQQVLSVQPDNEAARAGLRQIGVEYASLAEQAEARGASERARTYMDKALELAPDHPDVKAVAAALQVQQPATEAITPSASSVAVAVTPPEPSNSEPTTSVPATAEPTTPAPAGSADIQVSALAALPGTSGNSESLPVPRTQAPKPELLTSGLLYAVSGLDAHQAGRYDEAIEYYTLAIEAGDLPDRSLAYVYNNRGASYRNLDNYNQAIEDYDSAIRLNPDYATAFYNRGIAYDLKGFHSLAIDDFDTAIRLNPDLSDAYNQRGLAYVRDGRYDIAIENFSEAIRLDPQSDSAYFNRGLAYHSKGKTDLAADDIRKSRDLDPDNPKYVEMMRELGIL